MPISFHRSLHPFPAIDSARPVEDSLHHPYVATVAAGGSALPTIQRGLEPTEREEALVGTPLPVPVQEAVDTPSPATRFLSLLHEELVPEEYHKYLNVFSKKELERMPIRKPWDHAIDLKDTFKPKNGRIIPLSPQEQEEVTAFLDDQLKKGYIRPSKSPQTSPVFFVPKKDGKKCMVQEY